MAVTTKILKRNMQMRWFNEALEIENVLIKIKETRKSLNGNLKMSSTD